jgi:hypothetical protein
MSPEVWDDCIPRIEAVAEQLGIAVVELALEDPGPRPAPPKPWVDIEVAANTAGPMQIGYDLWVETGQIFIHLMVPRGSGMRPALVQRKAFSTAFRGINNTTIPGLIYSDDQSMDPMGPGTDDGVYRRLTLIVRYKFEDRLVATAPP